MRDPENITCLSLWGRTSAIRSRLARIARPRFAASGLDRTSPGPAGGSPAGKGKPDVRVLLNNPSMELSWSVNSCWVSAAEGEDERKPHWKL
jgi:hypothetical protein